MRHIESKIQQTIIKYVRGLYPSCLIYCIPNGARRNKISGGILKKEGLTAGVADLHLIYKKKIYFIEVKSETGSQSKEQKQFQKFVIEQGFEYWLVRSVDEVITKIEAIT